MSEFVSSALEYILGHKVQIAATAAAVGLGAAVTYLKREAPQPRVAPGSLSGKTILITGGNAGLGKAAAQEIASLGGRVVLLGRRKDALKAAVKEIQTETPNQDIHYIICNLSSLSSVRNAAAEFRKRFNNTLDILINNAALTSWGVKARTETEDGLETFWATNYLSHFLLTNLLLDLIKKSKDGRVINVGAMQFSSATIDFDDLQQKKKWSAMTAIVQAKLGMFAFTRVLAKKLEPEGIPVNILDPGLVMTPYQDNSGIFFRTLIRLVGRSASYVAKTYAYLAASEETKKITGKCWKYCQQKPMLGDVLDDAWCQRVWDESVKNTKL